MLNQPELFSSAGPAPCPALRQDLVLLDLETTGASAAKDRIIEVGLIHFKDFQITDHWSTLVNPQTPLSPFIEDYTGITSSMVSTAPRFVEIADELRQHLNQGLLVAHNARFDYGFLQKEYSRIGQDYQEPSLCTVQVSRKLFPTEKRHSLDAIINRHQLHCDSRHRALGDARVLADFLSDLPRHCPADAIEKAIKSQIKSNI